MNTPTVAIGDIVTYTIAVANTGNTPASATVLTDGLGAGASFIQNSVTIDNVPQPGLDPSLVFTWQIFRQEILYSLLFRHKF